MTYKINGTSITLQPSTGKWADREQIGVDGNGRAIYSAFRDFELTWELISVSDYQQLKNFFDTIGSTGTVVATLPQYGASSYADYDYTGCVLRDPQVGEYFETYISNVKMLIVHVRI